MKKNRIRLTESQLHGVIKECVKRVINESRGGWRGCPNVHMIWHGEWSDPELESEGYIANYYSVEDYLWADFQEEAGYSDNDANNSEIEEEFNDWLRENESYVIETIMDLGEPIEEDDEEEY